jgi:hypothetical protein
MVVQLTPEAIPATARLDELDVLDVFPIDASWPPERMFDKREPLEELIVFDILAVVFSYIFSARFLFRALFTGKSRAALARRPRILTDPMIRTLLVNQ